MPMHDHDTDDETDSADLFDFAMTVLNTRPGPCKAATAPEVDPVEKRLEREREEAEHIIAAVEAKTQRGPDAVINGRVIDYKYARAVEARHGSGKVKF